MPAQRVSRKALIFLVVGGLIAVAVVLFDWNWLRPPLADYLSARLDRPVRIDGDLHVVLSRQPLITAEFVSLGNTSWGSEKMMGRARRIAVRVDLQSLWNPPVQIPEIALTQPNVLLERNADGEVNWQFKPSDQPPRLDHLIIENGVVRFKNADTGTDVTVDVSSSGATEDGLTPVEFKGSGRLRNNPFTIEGTAASLLRLEDQAKPYRLNVKARAGSTSASFDGTVIPARLDNVDGYLTLQGRDLSELYPIIPVPFQWTPKYNVKGQLTHSSAVWSFRDFKGKVGDSDVAGNFILDGGHARPVIDADIVSQRLDYKDLGGFVGLPPGKEAASQRTEEQNQEAAKRAQSDRALPTKPYDLERLRVIDGTVRFKGKRFISTGLPLDDMKVTLVLDNGIVKLQPLDFGVAGGRVVSTLVMDARNSVIKTRGDVRVDNVELKEIAPSVKPPEGSAGKLDGRARFAATGNSVADMLGSADGEVALTSTGGDMSEFAVVLTNLDLAQAFVLKLKGDQPTPLRCVVANFVAEKGRMTAKSFVIDTAAVKINGEGSIDFAKENLALTLKAESKRASLVALRGPIMVDGTFKSPKVHAATGPVAARLGAAAALGVLAPPAALLPLIEFGGAKDADCDALTQQAQANVDKMPAPVPPKVGRVEVAER
jgi:uncharacterized protein involved in outer membrane biogenesis